ncbi:MAG TPA: Holliday junction resolvase RuvX [Plantibacter sp.]|uniref:Holliday junction resolvase RuvX n=1 Tax=unclassified Plantibacter TaxID=2624265 RepID=UPI002D0D8512|nr:Holliday junction resolvase RuvX [Plantibacter sp.]
MADGFRPGVRLGIDVGKARVGVARSDPDGLLATPVQTVARDLGGDTDIAAIAAVAAEIGVVELVVGLPIALSGKDTASTQDAREFAARLTAATGLPGRLVDERLTTVTAHSALRSAGKRQKQTRSIVDQVAAVILLQYALDAERGSGRPPGTPVEP